jgi:hypothetical protein
MRTTLCSIIINTSLIIATLAMPMNNLDAKHTAAGDTSAATDVRDEIMTTDTTAHRLPPDITGEIMRYLSPEDRLKIIHFPGGKYHFDQLAPESFIKKFSTKSVQKLIEHRLPPQFVRKVFHLLGTDRLSFIINYSAYRRDWTAVRFMLQNKADPNLLLYSVRRAALHHSNDLGHLRELLANYPNFAFEQIIRQAMNPDLDRLNDLLMEYEFHSDMNTKTGSQAAITPDAAGWFDRLLFKASGRGQVQLVRELMELGADIHLEKDHLLRFAARSNHHNLIRIVLPAGADIYAQNGESFACATRYWFEETTKLLLHFGGDIYPYKTSEIRPILTMMRLMNLDSRRLVQNSKGKAKKIFMISA